MPDKTFYCFYETARFPISELGKDNKGNPIHRVADGPCHFPDGNLCVEEPVVSIMIASREEQEAFWKQLQEP